MDFKSVENMCFLLSNGFNMKMRQVPVGRGGFFYRSHFTVYD